MCINNTELYTRILSKMYVRHAESTATWFVIFVNRNLKTYRKTGFKQLFCLSRQIPESFEKLFWLLTVT